MGTIAVEQRQYSTYILTNEVSHSRLEVVPERGGIITRWQVRDRDILYLDADRFADPTLTVRGGIPILFPICGNLPDNTYSLNGQSYTLKQHGFARDLPWTVLDQVTGDRLSLVLGLESNDQTRAVYPFDFQLTFTYTLDGETLATHQRYTNCSPEPMPFSVGFHPYFQVSDKSQLALEIPAGEFRDQKTQSVHPYDGRFDWEQDEIDAAFANVSSQVARVTDHSERTRLTLEYSNTFSTLVFWTLKGKQFYCLEPWSAPRNALNTGEHLLHLAPGASLETVMNLTVDFLD